MFKWNNKLNFIELIVVYFFIVIRIFSLFIISLLFCSSKDKVFLDSLWNFLVLKIFFVFFLMKFK